MKPSLLKPLLEYARGKVQTTFYMNFIGGNALHIDLKYEDILEWRHFME